MSLNLASKDISLLHTENSTRGVCRVEHQRGLLSSRTLVVHHTRGSDLNSTETQYFNRLRYIHSRV